MKRFVTILMALVIILSLATTAFADNVTGTITVTDQKIAAGETNTTYEVYRIFDVAASNDFDSIAYTINSAWAGFFATGAAGADYIVDTNVTTANGGKGYAPIVVEGSIKYIALTNANIDAFGKAALAYSQTKPVAPVASNTTGAFTGLPLGYYMVYPKGANLNVGNYSSIVSLTTTKPDAEVTQKAEYPTLAKTDNDDSVQVGQTVTYILTTKVPDTTGFRTFSFVIYDQMTDGLTFNSGSVAVTIGEGVDILNIEPASEGASGYILSNVTAPEGYASAFSISIPVMDYQAYIGKTITVTYNATVNSNAVTQVEKNKATLVYSNNPKNADDKTTTPPDEEIVYSAKIVIYKYDATNEAAKLANAKFVLRCKSVADTGNAAKAEAGKYYAVDANGNVSWVEEPGVDDKVTAKEAALEKDVTAATIVVTDANGAASFNGLENGVYELIEVAAPAGYNQIKGVAAEVTVQGTSNDAASLSVTTKIANKSGTELPSTGGMGTTLFYILGGVMMLGAVVLLVTKKRMADAK